MKKQLKTLEKYTINKLLGHRARWHVLKLIITSIIYRGKNWMNWTSLKLKDFVKRVKIKLQTEKENYKPHMKDQNFI